MCLDKYSNRLTAGKVSLSYLEWKEFADQHPEECFLVVCEIGPKEAQMILDGDRPANRNINPINLKSLCRELEEGNFISNWESIKHVTYHDNSAVVDGQHRITAVIETQIPIITAVAFNLPPGAEETIDQHKPRTIGDIFKIQEVDVPRKAQAPINMMLNYINNGIPLTANNIWTMVYWGFKVKYLPRDYKKYLHSHPEIAESARLIWTLADKAPIKSPRGMIATLHFFYSYYCGLKEQADRMVRDLYKLDMVSVESPSYQLNRYFLNEYHKIDRTSPRALNPIVFCWRQFMDGRNVRQTNSLATYVEKNFHRLTGMNPDDCTGINRYLPTPIKSNWLGGKYSLVEEIKESTLFEKLNPDRQALIKQRI